MMNDLKIDNLFLSGPSPAVLIVMAAGEEETSATDHITNVLSSSLDSDYALLIFQVKDWNKDLSPWEAPPVFGKESFGCGAEQTLSDILRYIDDCVAAVPSLNDIPAILCGYSLAGLFALWSAYQTDRFSGIAAVSPSVWFPGWAEYTASHSVHTRCVYLSLGDKEAKTRNPVMATVRDRIESCYASLSSENGMKTVLEFNPGNHFQDAPGRLTKGILWTVHTILGE